MECQLNVLPEAGKTLNLFRRLQLRLSPLYVARVAKRVLTNPSIVLRKLGLRPSSAVRKPPMPSGNGTDASPIACETLGLQAGDRVQVKSWEEIRATLDAEGKYDRMAYMPIVMNRYCGGVYTVRRRVEHFFDERERRLMKLRNAVILDDVHCEPPRDETPAWAGCDRMCFLFWKEAWLRRAPND